MIDQQEELTYLTTCPINLDAIHCASCYFIKDGSCKYEEIVNGKETPDSQAPQAEEERGS